MINPIRKSNEWYDNLPKLKRDLFFLIFIFGSLLVAQVLTYVEDKLWALPTWMIIWSLWRIPYILTQYKK
jgi:hypothetical protein